MFYNRHERGSEYGFVWCITTRTRSSTRNRPYVFQADSRRESMAADIGPIWERIHNWLEKSCEETLSRLNEGATNEQIEELESKCHVQLPECFKASYEIHNGSGAPLFDGLQFMTIKEIIGEWTMLKDIVDENDTHDEYDAHDQNKTPSKFLNKWWDPKWIPFANDNSGNNIVVDMAPGEEGVMGQVFFWYHDGGLFKWLAASFTEFLADFAKDLEDGKFGVDEEQHYLYLKE